MKISAFLLLGILFSNYISSQIPGSYSKNEIIIKFKENLDVEVQKNLIENKVLIGTNDSLINSHKILEVAHIGKMRKKDTYLLTFSTNLHVKELIHSYKKTNLFEFVEPNFIGSDEGKRESLKEFPNDVHFSRQWGLYNDGVFSFSPAKNDADMDMELAWDIEKGSSSIVIAILDGGLKMDHPDIKERIWKNNIETFDGLDDDDNGYIDDIQGWDFVNNDNDPTDLRGHGTNIAGIIGADANNNIGYTGVDWNSRLMVCRVIDENGLGMYSDWIEAIYYAVDNGANVINMSISGSNFSVALKDAIDFAYDSGVVVVASMGNKNNNVTRYPAGYTSTIAVGATNPNDERSSPFFWDTASGSNFGNHIDVVAPGNYIYGLNYQSNSNYNTYWGGTSQAAPLVAGLCALLLAQDSTRTPADIRSIIRITAEDQVGKASEDNLGFDIYYGFGRINAYLALANETSSSVRYSNKEDDIVVFPNPSTDILFVKSIKTVRFISFRNLLGIDVLKKRYEVDQELFEINISNLPSGMYLLIASDVHGSSIYSQKVIVK